MTISRERVIMGLLLAALPVLLYGGLLRPSLLRQAELRRRIHAAHDEAPGVQSFTPVREEERSFLEAPRAPWRTRLALVAGDAERLDHMNRVVTGLGAALKARGVRATVLRAAWEPVTAEFTLPAELKGEIPPGLPVEDGPEHALAGWVLEVEIAGPTGELFKALSAAPDVHALLEPVGLRWQASAKDGGRQCLLLRNLYLKP